MVINKTLKTLLEIDLNVRTIIPLATRGYISENEIFDEYDEIILSEEFYYLNENPIELKIENGEINYNFLIGVEHPEYIYYFVINSLEELEKLKEFNFKETLYSEESNSTSPFIKRIADTLIPERKEVPMSKRTFYKIKAIKIK